MPGSKWIRSFWSGSRKKKLLKPMEWGAFLTYIRGGDAHQLFLLGWSGNADPDGILFPLFHSKNFGAAGNRAFYKNEKVDQLLREARRLSDQGKRQALYEEASRIVVSEAADIWIYNTIELRGLSNRLQGFKFTPVGSGALFRVLSVSS